MAEPVELIADDVVGHLNALELDKNFKAYKPEIANLKVEDPDIVVQVIPIAGGNRQKVGRRAVRREHLVNLYVTADTNPTRDRASMVSFVGAMLDSLEFVPMAGKTWSETEEISLYDRDAQKQAGGRFVSLHRLRYVEEYCK